MDFGACFMVALVLGALLVVVVFALQAWSNNYTATYIPPRQQIKHEALSELDQIERNGHIYIQHAYNRYMRRLLNHYTDEARRSVHSYTRTTHK